MMRPSLTSPFAPNFFPHGLEKLLRMGKNERQWCKKSEAVAQKKLRGAKFLLLPWKREPQEISLESL